MADHFFEWLFSKSNPRFKAYREGRLLYEGYLREVRVSFDDLTEEQQTAASHDPRLQSAEQLYRQAIVLSRESDARTDVATALYQLGMLLHLTGRLNEATECFWESLSISESMPQPMSATISGCYYHLGLIDLKRGHHENARHFLKRSLAIDEANHDFRGALLVQATLKKCEGADSDTDVDMTRPPAGPSQSAPPSSAPGYRPTPVAEKPASRPSPPMVEGEIGLRGALSPIHDVVWLLSYSETANDRFLEPLEELAGALPRDLIVTRAAFGSPNREHATLPPLAAQERLCATVLIVERDGLQNEDFLYWANWCMDAVAARGDFRLFVCLHDLAASEITDNPDNSPFFRMLTDTVQLLDPPSPGHLQEALRDYLSELDDIRAEMEWRRLRTQAGVFLGMLAFAIQLFCGIAVSLVGLAVPLAGLESVVGFLEPLSSTLIGVVAGIIVFPLCATPLFLLVQGVGTANALLEHSPPIRYWVLACFVIAPAALGISEQTKAPTGALILGLILGVLLDHARRNSNQARRDRLSLSRALTLSGQSAPSLFVARAGLEHTWNPMRCPLFPAMVPRVFISYARASQWGSSHAVNLYHRLHEEGIHVFYDRAEIGEGSSWRNRLSRSLADTNVFVVILDDVTMSRPWVAAEVLIALASRSLTSLPDVIILLSPDAARPSDASRLPVFDAVLERKENAPRKGSPRFIMVNADTLASLTAGLHPHRYNTPSVLPGQLSLLLELLSVPLVGLGALGVLPGFVAGLFALFEQWGKVQSGETLAGWGILVAVYLLCGFWFGFVTRLTVACRYEVRHDTPGVLIWAHALAALGFLGVLLVWSVGVAPVTIGWSVALAWIGWLTSNVFVNRVRSENSDFWRKMN